MSNRLTFSLASLILILGLVFATAPAMAHDLVPGETGDQHVAGINISNHTAHPVVTSATFKGDAADGYVGNDSFQIEVVFAAANATNKIAAPPAVATGDISVTGFNILDANGGATKRTYRVDAVSPTSGDSVAVTINVPEAYPTTVTEGLTITPASVTFDSIAPTVADGVAQPMATKSFPLNNELSEAFDVVFTLTDEAESGTDSTATTLDGTTFALTASPNEVTFSDKRSLGNNKYAATVTPKTVTTTETTTTSVTITASVKDKAGNMGESDAANSVTVTLAKRTAGTGDTGGTGGTGTGDLADGDTRDNITQETEFDLSGTLASSGYVVIAQMNRTDIPGDEIVLANLPNIQRFFARGGTISLVGGASKSVVISEIMWGLNTAAAVEAQANKQWIELFNPDNDLTDTDATNDPKAAIDLSKYKLVFTPGTVLPTPANLADQVSNIIRSGWDVDIGQSGAHGAKTDAFTPEDMISMYRNINYVNLTKKHKDKADENKTEQLKAIPGGSSAAGWAASTVNDTYASNQLGSPGGRHFVGRSTLDSTSPTYGVVINEIGNNSSDRYDWIELLNRGTGEVNLKKWEITKFTKVGDEAALVSFPDNDHHKIPAGGILLIVQSDPYQNSNHPLTAGIRINHPSQDLERGLETRYYVASGLKLPDDGDFGLLVRNANDKENKPTNIVDFTAPGALSKLDDPSSSFRTSQWPLAAQAAGSGDIIKDVKAEDEAFDTSAVFQRNKQDASTAKETWTKAGNTGVGYKRSATTGNGTPGYPNNVVTAFDKKSDHADYKGAAPVTISEIMYDRGRRNKLPQWIELYNSSKTMAVTLSGWKLKIENDDADDVDAVNVRIPAVTIKDLGGTVILPNQTILIVAYKTGNTSSVSQGNLDFPSDRVIDLSSKDELEISDNGGNKRSYRLLSETAFKLTLMDKGGNEIDTAGNLDADPAWTLPITDPEMNGRSSIIRRYNTGSATGTAAINGSGEGMPQDGTLAVWTGKGNMEDGMAGDSGWVLASASSIDYARANETHYGSPDDVGTPGFRAGGALPVSLSKFRPERLKDTGEIVIRWITESELNNAGFNILRSETRNGQFTKINTSLIAGQGTTSERTTYEWKDTSAKPTVVYYYQIQDVSLDGQVQTLRMSRLKGNVTAAGKLTTTWGALKALQ